VSGFLIIMEGQYGVGDLVEINGVFGRVEEVGLRVTRLRDRSGEIHHFPNGTISTSNNYTQGYVAYVLTVPFPRGTVRPAGQQADEADLVRGILDDFEREFAVFAQPPVIGPAEDLPTYACVIRAELRCTPGRQSVLDQKLPARVTAALERAGHPLPAGTDVGLVLLPLPRGA